MAEATAENSASNSNVTPSIEDTAKRGIALNSKIKKLKKELDGVKTELREYATHMAGDTGESVEVETADGNVLISFRDDRVYISKGNTDKVTSLKEGGVLTDAAFDALFHEVITYDLDDEYEKAMSALSDLQKEKVREALSTTTYSPSVRFPNV